MSQPHGPFVLAIGHQVMWVHANCEKKQNQPDFALTHVSRYPFLATNEKLLRCISQGRFEETFGVKFLCFFFQKLNLGVTFLALSRYNFSSIHCSTPSILRLCSSGPTAGRA